MNHRKMIAVILLAMCVVAGSNKIHAQDRNPDPEMMAKWQAAMTPNEMHQKLQPMVGVWKVKAESWMNGPEPSVSEGTAEYAMVLGGRFLQEAYSGTMMGQPFNGLGYTGYDNVKKKYVGLWMDNMGTSVASMEGQFQPDGKTMTMWGKMDDPVSGKSDDVKYVTQMVDDNTMVFEMFDPSAGGSKPMMRLTYTRQTPPGVSGR